MIRMWRLLRIPAIPSLLLVSLIACGDTAAPTADTTEAIGRHPVDAAAIPEALRQPRPGTTAVTIAPAGTAHLAAPPRRFITFMAIEADIALALGQGDGLVGCFDAVSLTRLQRLFYDHLPGVRLPLETLRDLSSADRVDPEAFYRLAPDAILVDPRLPLVFWDWTAEQVAQVARRTGPFLGNFIRFGRDERWGPPYPQYTLDAYHARLAALFQAESRYRRFAAFRDAMLTRIWERLPPVEERPAICLINAGSQPERGLFYLVDLHGRDRNPAADPDRPAGGCWVQQYQDLGLRQAFAFDRFATGRFGLCDYETLAAIDPPLIIIQWGLTGCADAADFARRYLEPMRRHPIGRRLRAVREDRVIPGGTAEQGPITHLFQLEMAAQQLFPERFGTWVWGQAPVEPLFDRAALAAIIRGLPDPDAASEMP